MSNRRTLVIVEGSKAEYRFFKCLGELLELDLEVFPFNDNLYVLYQLLKKENFNMDIKSLLIEMFPEHRAILSEKYAFTYLIFDLDPQHTNYNDNREHADILATNLKCAREMTDYFQDETDPSVGKIYINYPMFESFRYCDSVFDDLYKDAYISLSDIKDFKTLAGKKKMVRRHVDHFSKDDYFSLTKMNIYKLNYLFSEKWEPLNYTQYQLLSVASRILDEQVNHMVNMNRIAVLNTSLFIMADYYGNRNDFYSQHFM